MHADNNWLKQVDRSKPVILVAMGSSGDWKKLDFLNENNYSRFTIIAAGDNESVLSAPHIIQKEFVNLSAVLQVSDLMICHAGNGTIYHALANGVYTLCLTSHFEQEWNAHALRRVGYGMSSDQFTPEDWNVYINKAIKMKLEPFFDDQNYPAAPGCFCRFL